MRNFCTAYFCSFYSDFIILNLQDFQYHVYDV